MCDFESAQHKAFAIEFPMAERNGCYFHASKVRETKITLLLFLIQFLKSNNYLTIISQAILLHAKEIGLLPLIQEYVICDTIVRSLCALPLLPTHKIKDGVLEMAEFTNNAGWWDQLSSFFVYIKTTWLRPSRLPIFSVYNCKHRTSNCCESYHHVMNSTVGQVAHPNVYFLICEYLLLSSKTVQRILWFFLLLCL